MANQRKHIDLNLVKQAAEKCISVRQYCYVMKMSTQTHYEHLRNDFKYQNAYTRGLSKRIEDNLKNIEDIANNSSEKAANARLDASKMLLLRGEKMLSNMGKGHYTTGDIKDQLIKVADDYAAGLIDTEFANAMVTIAMARAKTYELVELNPLVDAVKKMTEQK